ncbi:hypothetical protein [Psychrobacter communis]|uniref:Uncharacterized protein n=1 Tax=Psychrobacter communis TaxID=2762238 RepID=A0ABR8RFE9_9GAMM|nr:hypothetical protein [Psychrobacter communis]MBD7946454.1 hypothetical protein [Psychrobacter communis]
MPNSIRTTSNTQTPTNSTLATFKAGDAVLCPSVGDGTYKLFNKSKDCLTINIGNVECLYRADGRAYHDDCYVLPSLFHDTEANRQAIATLYSGSQSNQRTLIDTTEADDKQVILISAFDLSDIACDIDGAATALYDIGQLLALIHYDKIEAHTVPALARLAHDATDTWANLLYEKLEGINDTLAMTGYSKVGK